jgi:hypothetical protein
MSFGSGLAARAGFTELTEQIALGQVGVVLALEVSRLARNNAHWHRLLEICAMSGTLICDEDELSVVFSYTRSYFMVDAPDGQNAGYYRIGIEKDPADADAKSRRLKVQVLRASAAAPGSDCCAALAGPPSKP